MYKFWHLLVISIFSFNLFLSGINISNASNLSTEPLYHNVTSVKLSFKLRSENDFLFSKQDGEFIEYLTVNATKHIKDGLKNISVLQKFEKQSVTKENSLGPLLIRLETYVCCEVAGTLFTAVKISYARDAYVKSLDGNYKFHRLTDNTIALTGFKIPNDRELLKNNLSAIINSVLSDNFIKYFSGEKL